MVKTIAVACMFAGGLGSFISRALDNDNTPTLRGYHAEHFCAPVGRHHLF